MLTTGTDAAIERAVALPKYILPEQDDILKATVCRFVYIQPSFKASFNQTRFSHDHCLDIALALSLHILRVLCNN